MSLRRYLVLMLSAVLVLVTFSAAIQGYKNSMQQAASLADNNLRSLSQTLIKLGVTTTFSKSISPLKTIDQPTISSSDIVVQIWQQQQLLFTSNNSIKDKLSNFNEGFSDQNVLAKRWRVYSHQQNNTWLMVAQPVAKQFSIAEKLILSAMTPLIFSIPIIAILIWFIVWRTLMPLTQLSHKLTLKKANDLSPIKLKYLSSELNAVQNTLNQLFSRIALSFQQEKEFASNAAHELRTPLTALKLTSHHLLHEYKSEVVQQLVERVDRLSHVVDQILVLNRITPEQFNQQLQRVNIKKIAQEVIASLYIQIHEKQQNISLYAEDIELQSTDIAIVTLLQNLISNAHKYSPKQGEIIVTIHKKNDDLIISVEDSGKGIEESERDKVFERFYRVGGDQHASQTIGCGLGLSIVKHIVFLHKGHVSLHTSTSLKGLKVLVKLPLGNNDEMS